MLASYNWLKEFVDIQISPKELAHKLTMAGFEVESITPVGDDTVYEVNVTPNRGDCLSIIGLAREVAAILQKNFKSQISNLKPKQGGLKIKDFVSVEVKDKVRCPRYTARAIQGVKIGPSPDYISKRLEACGIRSINNVVDATNYLMLETGQPFHAFDHRDISGKKIIVKTPESAIEFTTLDDIKRKLETTDLLICDGSGPVAIGGVMGGLNSEVKSNTTTVVLESAAFNQASIRRTSRRLGVSTESSKRFERIVDPNSTLVNLNRLTDLIVKIAGGVPTSDWIDIYPKPVKPVKVSFSIKEANSLLGMTVKPEYVKKCFKSLGIAFNGSICTVPTYRPDLTRSADLVEEVARLYGYDKIPITKPSFEISAITKPEGFAELNKVKDLFVGMGFFEALNYGFCSPTELEGFSKAKPVIISNPLGIEFSAMKTSLLPGLLNNLKLNINLGQESLKLFEARPVFISNGTSTAEKKKITGVIYGTRKYLSWTDKSANIDFYDVKGIMEALFASLGLEGVEFTEAKDCSFLHPQASVSIMHNGRELGVCGLIHPSVAARWEIKGETAVFDLNWDELVLSIKTAQHKFKPLEKFQSVRRDVALLVDSNITSGNLILAVKEFNSKIIKSAMLFDVYNGKGIPEGKKSVAYAVNYFNPERTLTDEEVNDTHTKLVGYIKDKFGAEIR